MIGSFTPDNLRNIAATAVHDLGLDVIQPDWLAHDDGFDFIARDGDVLVAVHTVIARADDSSRDLYQLGEDRIHQIRGAAHAWASGHSYPCELIRVDLLIFMPMLDDMLGVAYAASVA
jgi:Holliday junction resolvase-like predicted endonuclease